MSNNQEFQIGIVIIAMIAISVFKFIADRRRMRLEKEEAARREAEEAESRKIDQMYLDKKRAELRKSREAHLNSVRRKNALVLKNTGVVWEDEAIAMQEYDKHYYKKWKALGMTPPSYIK